MGGQGRPGPGAAEGTPKPRMNCGHHRHRRTVQQRNPSGCTGGRQTGVQGGDALQRYDDIPSPRTACRPRFTTLHPNRRGKQHRRAGHRHAGGPGYATAGRATHDLSAVAATSLALLRPAGVSPLSRSPPPTQGRIPGAAATPGAAEDDFEALWAGSSVGKVWDAQSYFPSPGAPFPLTWWRASGAQGGAGCAVAGGATPALAARSRLRQARPVEGRR